MWTETEEADLDAIVSYIADESVLNAVALDARVRDGFGCCRIFRRLDGQDDLRDTRADLSTRPVRSGVPGAG